MNRAYHYCTISLLSLLFAVVPLSACKDATSAVSTPSGGGGGGGGGGGQQFLLPAYPAESAVLYTNADSAKASGGIGKTYSVQLGKQPKDDGYATVGNRNTGSYRVPSIVKTTVNGRTRLIAAFDVRYRGTASGNGDVGQSGAYGSDITVLYSDDGGRTWSAAVNKHTGRKPAIDVDNGYGPDGTTQSITLLTDVCDPQLTVAPDGTVYCGMAGGAGILGNNWSKSNFRIFKSTDNGVTWEEDTDPNDSYARKWDTSNGDVQKDPKFNITTPGHGIVLTKNVPGVASMTAGTMVMPIQGGKGSYGIYLAHGTGAPSTWTVGTSGGSTPWGRWNGNNSEEGQICQLDDGSILMASKTGGSTRLSRFMDNKWPIVLIANHAFNSGGSSQVSILKVAEGDGRTKCGVVAVCHPMSGPPRANLTVGFARDKSAVSGTAENDPLDNTTCYYVNIRAEAQQYFGYTDMVMINDTTLGILYENWNTTDDTIDGMRFVAIDVSEVVSRLSAMP